MLVPGETDGFNHVAGLKGRHLAALNPQPAGAVLQEETFANPLQGYHAAHVQSLVDGSVLAILREAVEGNDRFQERICRLDLVDDEIAGHRHINLRRNKMSQRPVVGFGGGASHADFRRDQVVGIHDLVRRQVGAKAVTAGSEIHGQPLTVDSSVADHAGNLNALAVLGARDQSLDADGPRRRQRRRPELGQSRRGDDRRIRARVSDAGDLQQIAGMRPDAVGVVDKYAAGFVLDKKPSFQGGVRGGDDALDGDRKRKGGPLRRKRNNRVRVGQRSGFVRGENGCPAQQENPDETGAKRKNFLGCD